MSEQPSTSLEAQHMHSPEQTQVPIFDELVSETGIASRRQWLADMQAGEYDVALGHIGRLYDRRANLMEKGIKAQDTGDFKGGREQFARADVVDSMITEIFGNKAFRELLRLRQATDRINKEYPTIEYWGEQADTLTNKLKSKYADTAHTRTEADRRPSAELTRDIARDYLNTKPYIVSEVIHRYVDEKQPVLRFNLTEPTEIPISLFISAGSFESWAGRSVDHNKPDGMDDKAYTTKNGEHVVGRSIDAIIDYASRETDLPPVGTARALVQPNGEVYFGLDSDSHRVAAAMLKGDSTIKAEEIEVRYLTENLITERLYQEY